MTRGALARAALRPVHLVAPGAGLLMALASERWWLFPLSLAVLGAMAWLAARRAGDAAVDWEGALDAVTQPRVVAALRRVRASEARLAEQVAGAPGVLREALAVCVAQGRAAGRAGVELARRAEALGAALAAADGARARREAARRREWARDARDEDVRQELAGAARAYDEAAGHAEALAAERERCVARLEGLAAALEGAAVRAARLRVDGAHEAAPAALRADVEALRATLEVFEGPARDARAVRR